ncbi:MAG: hypothetical protein ACKOIB_07785, partial [Verrucomicrobiota bacterium]
MLAALLVTGCGDAHVNSKEELARRVASMEEAYRAAHALARTRIAAVPVPDSDYVKLPTEELIKRTRLHASKFISDPKRIPYDDVAPDAREEFKSLYELCLREEILRSGTSLWRAIALRQPDACKGVHEGYY